MDDLARAHLDALRYLVATGNSDIMNCGYGHGFSVREVVDTARRVTGIDIPVEDGPRRAGDPPALVADNSRIRTELGWKPKHDDIEYIIRTAWDWERKR